VVDCLGGTHMKHPRLTLAMGIVCVVGCGANGKSVPSDTAPPVPVVAKPAEKPMAKPAEKPAVKLSHNPTHDAFDLPLIIRLDPPEVPPEIQKPSPPMKGGPVPAAAPNPLRLPPRKNQWR
jgi:hypothetical protein